MSEHAVVVVGAGPTGMMLGAELRLAGVDVAVLERRPDRQLAGSRAGGLQSRAIELLDQRGVADRFLAEGQTAQVAGFAGVTVDMSDFPTRHPYALGLWQNHIERIMGEWIGELGVSVSYGSAVTGFTQDDAGVEVELADGRTLRTEYLIGCDGGRSVVRKGAGIDFPGWEATKSNLIAEVELAEEPEWGVRHDAIGIHGLSRLEEGGPVRAMVTERQLGDGREPTLRDLSEGLIAVYGTDYGVHSPTWISRFTDTTRQAATYRRGRVLLAGDSAHIHSPAGGQGISIGMQDAVNLGWKLAQVVKRAAPDSLLDTYHAERHPAAARSLRYTMAQSTLQRGEERIGAVREEIAALLEMEEPRKHIAALVSNLDVRYDLGEGHALLGRRMPDLDLETAGGPLRVYALLHGAQPVLLNLGQTGAFAIGPWAERVRSVDAACEGPWELPAIGPVPAPSAVLIRPDGHVAWVGEGTDQGLADALRTWFGPPL